MKQHIFSRTELLIGSEGLARLENSYVAVFGVGGVGSYAAEALARAGIGRLTLVDFDEICLTNINRQIHALHSTVGQPKVEVMAQRIKEINPKTDVQAIQDFYTPEKAYLIPEKADYLIDAVDTVSAKVDLILTGRERNIPVVSAMGAGNRLDPTGYKVADISQTRVDPLAREVRQRLRKKGVTSGVKVVYSEAPVIKPKRNAVEDCRDNCVCPGGDGHCAGRNTIPGSISFVPPVVGMFLAAVVVNDLLDMSAGFR